MLHMLGYQSMNVTPAQTTCTSSNPSPDTRVPPPTHFTPNIGCKDNNGNNIGQSTSPNNPHDGYIPNMPIANGNISIMTPNSGSEYKFENFFVISYTQWRPVG